jgi:predicted DNA-binding transcriptional regulator YafY
MLHAAYCVRTGEWTITHQPCQCPEPGCISFRVNSPSDGRRIVVLAAALQSAYRNAMNGDLDLKSLANAFAAATGHPIETWRPEKTMSDDTTPSPVFAVESDGSVKFRYRNHEGKVALRHVRFQSTGRNLFWGRTEFHPEEQWLLETWDLDRNQGRTFALKDILPPE